jgi:predicted N-acetyltransferase YhbS
MPELRSYLKHEVPRDIACQIRSFIRIQWPHLNAGNTTIWTPPPGVPKDRMTFVATDNELLVSHAEANFRRVEHRGRTWRVGGLSAVFTYPAYRGSGWGEQVVRAATAFLRRSDADLALLFCGERVQPLYERVGWTHLPAARILSGDPAKPTPDTTSRVMALFLSDNGHAARGVFESEAVYVGPNTW